VHQLIKGHVLSTLLTTMSRKSNFEIAIYMNRQLWRR